MMIFLFVLCPTTLVSKTRICAAFYMFHIPLSETFTDICMFHICYFLCPLLDLLANE